MDFFSDLIRKSAAFKELQKDFMTKQFCHAYLFLHSDKMFLERFLKIAALTAVCANGGCGQCISCRKAQSGNHADILVYPRKKEALITDEAKEISQGCFVLPVESTVKAYIIQNFDKADHVVQNKLLKTFEEPPDNTVFFIGASNESALLATIKSRCRRITLEECKFDDVVNLLVEYGIAAERAAVAAAVSGCKPEKAFDYAKSQNFFTMFDDIVNVALSLNSSKDALSAVTRIQNYRDRTDEVLGILHTLFYQTLVLQTQPELLLLSARKNDIILLSEKFSQEALTQILPLINSAAKKLESRCNPNSVLDSLVLSVLEVKHKCPKL